MFRDARLDKGLDLRDVATQTRVRKQYLLALEEGQYDALPENVYTRNFIRLFAGALGLDSNSLLELYDRERAAFEGKTAPAIPAVLANSQMTNTPRTAPSQQNLAVVKRHPVAGSSAPAGVDIGNVLPTLLLVVVIVGLALWAWDSGLLPGAGVEEVRPTVETPETPNPVASQQNNASTGTFEPISPDDTALAGTSTIADAATVGAELGGAETSDAASITLLSITTVPEGARVSVDNYEFPNVSPIDNAPLSAGADRVLRVELEGYRVYEAPIDLSFNRNLEVYLTPLGEEGTDDVTEDGTEASSGELVDVDNPTASSDDSIDGATTEIAAVASDDVASDAASNDITAVEAVPIGPLTVSVEIVDAASWLEVYQGDDRGVGTTLLYRTAEPGETFEYEAPVYLFAGNAGNVLVSVDGGDPEAIGATGQVTGRAFAEESSVE
jgi:cytoskeletal protein RodZ